MDERKNEAIKRLSMLEEMYQLNPKVRQYYENDRLYYSYLTAGGYMGSIDTITYDKRYPEIVAVFERETSAIVYHAIEYNNGLALLYVSDSTLMWKREQPTFSGILACIYDFEENTFETGYIKVDSLDGALYRKNTKLYSYEDIYKRNDAPDDISEEILSRLQILIDQGIETDLDIYEIYKEKKELCISDLRFVYNTPVGVIDYLSVNDMNEKIINKVFNVVLKEEHLIPYFVMKRDVKSNHAIMAVLYVSENETLWSSEKRLLNNQLAPVIAIDLEHGSIYKAVVEYAFINGGPYFVSLKSDD